MSSIEALPYILTFIEGILTFVSPCILPMLPVYLVYLAGNASNAERKASKRVANAVAFVAGFTLIYVLLGATATSLGYFLHRYEAVFRQVSGGIMILFGLNFIGLLRLRFLDFEKRLEYSFQQLNFFSSILFGMVFAFGWSACAGQYVGSALLLAGNSGTVVKGMLLLLLYSLGLGIPFIVTAIIFDKMRTVFAFIQQHQRIINILSGLLLIGAGILVITDRMKYLGTSF